MDDHGRPEPPVAAGELETLVGFLEYQRSTLMWKTRGLDATGLRHTIAASSMTLAGLLKHLAYVEDHWFGSMLHDRPQEVPWSEVDWKVTPDWEWESATLESPEVVRSQWSVSVDRARSALQEALQQARDLNDPDPLGTLAKRPWPNGEKPSVRWILVHMIEEYARHNGHADLLREDVDGEVGE